ncbi:MAG: hypothetical protein KDJ17_07310 [Hyphomicrobiaceae bacterium]|nr:hypothetical protein [Hyphomicrobiaceae bacterium]
MIFARIAVAGAILCSLWFNGSYAWSKGGTFYVQLSLVTLAVTIDLCKCGFLAAASALWRAGWRIAPFCLVVLWLPALAYSTFAGYASITTSRAQTSVEGEAKADARARAQAAYDAASATLAQAAKSPLWQSSSACTAPSSKSQRRFCESLDAAKDEQARAAADLAHADPVAVDPELTVLVDTTALPTSTLSLIVALWPALLIELVASIGLYAVTRPMLPEPSKRAQEAFSKMAAVDATQQSKNDPARVLAGTEPKPVEMSAPEAHAPRALRWPKAQPA